MEQSILEQVTSYEAACQLTNTQPLTLEQFKQILPEEDAQYHYSLHRIYTGIRAVKQGRKLDYDDDNQYKHYPWWDMETYGNSVPGSGFSLYGVGYGGTNTDVGARLSMHEDEDVHHIAKVFEEDYRVIMKSE